MYYTVLFSINFLLVGLVLGWLGADKYREFITYTTHEFDELFEANPHPELFDKDGKLNKGDYMYINFDLGYNPDEFDPEDIIEEG